MNEIVKLYKDHPVRIVERDGGPWFVAKDVCEVLGISKYRDAVTRLDSDEGCPVLVDTPYGKQEMIAVNEPGLYSLILRSRKPEAKAFKRWVTHDVLPSIRKTGAYVAPNAGLEQIAAMAKKIGEMAKHLISENSELREKNAFLEQFIPKGEFGDPSKTNGNPKWQLRRGYYVSRNGSRPKRLNPETNGYLQRDLFLDFLPAALIADAVNIINIHCPQLLEENANA